ncbi:MAG: hypothetical protein JO061_11810 [Acidobacteriaceae bacterium]|nr:hypothetical protein [Acidobacteriaceae bacterium]
MLSISAYQTVCTRCHARLHRLAAIHYWMPQLLAVLWEEQHPAIPLQMQFPEDILSWRSRHDGRKNRAMALREKKLLA